MVTYGSGIVDGHPAFGVNWVGVGYYDSSYDKLDAFQLVFVNISDNSNGDFDMEFNYGEIQWETGEASHGNGGLGGDSAHVGYAGAGGGFEMSGSGIPGTFLDANAATGLIYGEFNASLPGRYLFQFRGGVPQGNP